MITSPSKVAKQIPISISPSSSLDGFIEVSSVSGIKCKDKKVGMIIAAYQDLSMLPLINQSNVRSSKTNVSKPYHFGIVLLEIKLLPLLIIWWICKILCSSLLFYKIKERTSRALIIISPSNYILQISPLETEITTCVWRCYIWPSN